MDIKEGTKLLYYNLDNECSIKRHCKVGMEYEVEIVQDDTIFIIDMYGELYDIPIDYYFDRYFSLI
jgi:hypothetical protein